MLLSSAEASFEVEKWTIAIRQKVTGLDPGANEQRQGAKEKSGHAHHDQHELNAPLRRRVPTRLQFHRVHSAKIGHMIRLVR